MASCSARRCSALCFPIWICSWMSFSFSSWESCCFWFCEDFWFCAEILLAASLALEIAGMRIPMRRAMIETTMRISGTWKPLLSFGICYSSFFLSLGVIETPSPSSTMMYSCSVCESLTMIIYGSQQADPVASLEITMKFLGVCGEGVAIAFLGVVRVAMSRIMIPATQRMKARVARPTLRTNFGKFSSEGEVREVDGWVLLSINNVPGFGNHF